MMDERLSVVAVKCSLGRWFCALNTLRVYIDGQLVGQVGRNRTQEFLVTPGEHLVTVALTGRLVAGLPLDLLDGDRAELICTTDAELPNWWMRHSLWSLVFFLPLSLFVIFNLFFNPPLAIVIAEITAIDLLVLGVMMWVGMIIYFWRVYKRGVWNPSIYLEEQFEGEQP